MKYLFEKGTGRKFILLHGTGGDEYSMVDIAQHLDPQSTILSFRGEINENGMNRFFKRNGLNQFDIPSLEKETDHLLEQITAISDEQGINMDEWIILGYSNGANIAGHLFLERQTELNKAILLHPMSLGVDSRTEPLKDKKVFLSYGEEDPIVSLDAFKTLENQLGTRGTQITEAHTEAGHQITVKELEQVKKWLADLE
ncbi:alpha/beta hydrolase [Enterococcus sp. BWB1-3]|uniref:alpha/beta hydrolase n=1 Tax=Enterococcus sp. BWB1-3 TaxID=2787713 RepID=UPI0019211270|nr:alpha/beta hydrolase [Enterococcus sp. BWB1-3]MBL1230090.1 alpha/beta hydrolase [Enterococcus sp. BWB1-3]